MGNATRSPVALPFAYATNAPTRWASIARTSWGGHPPRIRHTQHPGQRVGL